MTRCEFAGRGICPPYIAAEGSVLREHGLGNPLLSGIDMSIKCKEEGLPCYDQDHKDNLCHKEILRKTN